MDYSQQPKTKKPNIRCLKHSVARNLNGESALPEEVTKEDVFFEIELADPKIL
jgi:hypothetical protein